jgi:hypothetical protein
MAKQTKRTKIAQQNFLTEELKMLKPIKTLQEELQNKPVKLVQENGHLVIKQKNTAIFTLTLCGNSVNFKKADYEALQAIPDKPVKEPKVATKETTAKVKKEKKAKVETAEKSETSEPAPAKGKKIKPIVYVEVDIETLEKKIENINRCQGKELITVTKEQGQMTINNDGKVFVLTIHDDKLSMNIADYKTIKNPKTYDSDGKIIPIRMVARLNRPPQEPKVVEVKYHTIELQQLERKVKRINQCVDSELFTITKNETSVQIAKNGDDPYTIEATLNLTDGKEEAVMLLSDYKLIKNPPYFDENGNRIRVVEFLKTKPRKERVKKEKPVKEPRVKKEKPVKPVNYNPMVMKVNNLYAKIARLNRIMKSKVVEFNKDDRIITIKNTLNDTRYHIVIMDDGQITVTQPDFTALQVPVQYDENGKRIKLA